jgi:hypothetical protein
VYNILHFITREVSGEGETKEENGSADIILMAAKKLKPNQAKRKDESRKTGHDVKNLYLPAS